MPKTANNFCSVWPLNLATRFPFVLYLPLHYAAPVEKTERTRKNLFAQLHCTLLCAIMTALQNCCLEFRKERTVIFKQQFYYAGEYARLSDEDDQDGESCSIDSQRKIMQQFAELGL